MKDIIERLKGYFEDKEEAVLVFVFGSFTGGHMTEESDVDIAILFKDMPDFKEILQLKEDISELVKREADIVVLNNSSPIVRMQVLKKGVLIIKKSSAIYNDFFVRTVKEYDDLKHLRREIEKNILKGRIYA